jgi:ankyrin repeat protein
VDNSRVLQRWERPFDFEPGHWKKQLATKVLSLAAKGDVRALRVLLQDHPEFLNKRGPHGRTLVWMATRSGRFEAVKFLVEQGAAVNATGCYNSETHVQVTPYCAARYYKRDHIAAYLQANGAMQDIFRAAYLGDQLQVERELASNPELLKAEDPCDEIYFIPLLSFAVAGGHAELAQFLIRRGEAVTHYSAQLLYLAAKVPRLDLIELLVAHNADVSAVDSGIFISISNLHVMRYLLNQGASANQIGKNGFPPLVYLARGDKAERPDKLQVLLDYGADVNATGPHQRTALHYAAAGGHASVVAVLLERGADTTLKDERGETALRLARTARKISVVELLKMRDAKKRI